MRRYTTTRDRRVLLGRERGRRSRKRWLAALLGLLVVFVGTGSVAYALLVAVGTGSESATTGTLNLTLAPASGSTGFTGSVGPIAPTDVVNRFVDVTNGGTLDAQTLTMSVAAAPASKLTTDTTNGLKVTVSTCPVAWSVAGNSCSAGSSTPINYAAVGSLGAGAAQTLVAGAVPVGATTHLRVTLTLPDQAETTINGVPQVSPTIQGLTTTLTWTFSVQQRAGTVSTS